MTLNDGPSTNVSFLMVAAAHRTWLLACVTSAALVLAVPAFAQSNDRSSATVVRQYVPVVHVDIEHAAPPPNLLVTPALRAVVALMLRRSHTFRRQCQRVANDPGVTVVLRSTTDRMPSRVRARTHIVRRATGTLVATIDIPPLDDDVELIAHELEHVIEQLDEIDLATAARRSNTGVSVAAQDQPVFETRRAMRVGLLVAREIRRTDR